MPDDLMFRPAAELARLVRAGEITARELVSASLERIEALEPQVNAFTHVDAEGALAAAEQIGSGDERPFAGVPIAIKDNKPVAACRSPLARRSSGTSSLLTTPRSCAESAKRGS